MTDMAMMATMAMMAMMAMTGHCGYDGHGGYDGDSVTVTLEVIVTTEHAHAGTTMSSRWCVTPALVRWLWWQCL